MCRDPSFSSRDEYHSSRSPSIKNNMRSRDVGRRGSIGISHVTRISSIVFGLLTFGAETVRFRENRTLCRPSSITARGCDIVIRVRVRVIVFIASWDVKHDNAFRVPLRSHFRRGVRKKLFLIRHDVRARIRRIVATSQPFHRHLSS